MYDRYLSRFKTILLNREIKNGNAGIVSGFAHTPDGSLFVSTESGNIFQYDSDYKVKQVIAVNSPATGSPVVIKCIYYDTVLNQLWIGTLRHGLYCLKNNRVTPVRLSSNSITGWEAIGVINQIQPAEDGLWLLSDKGGGLNFFSTKRNALTLFNNYEQLHDAVGKGSGRQLLSLSKDACLLSTNQSGVIYFEEKPNGRVFKILPDVNDVNHITYSAGKYYLSTNNEGLLVLDSKFSVLKHYTTRDGLLNNTVLSSFVTATGDVWLNTFSGLSHLNGSGKFANYHIRNGFPLAEINSACVQPADSGHLFIAGGKNAWVVYNGQDIYNNPYL